MEELRKTNTIPDEATAREKIQSYVEWLPTGDGPNPLKDHPELKALVGKEFIFIDETLAEKATREAGEAQTELEATPEYILAGMERALQGLLDETARTLGYDSIHTAVTYAGEPAVPKFQAEGVALRAWRSSVWEKSYEVLAEVEAGDREQPTESELLAEMPVFVTPG